MNALGATALALLALFVGTIAWLWITAGPGVRPPAPAEVTLHLPPPPKPEAPKPQAAAPAPATPASPAPEAQPALEGPATQKLAPAPETKPAPEAKPAPETKPPEAKPPEAKPAETKPAAPAPSVAEKAPPSAPEPVKPSIPAEKPPAAAPLAKPSPPPQAAPPPKVALVPAPVPDLVEQGENGPLPRIAPDGRMPWQVYARPFDRGDPRPRIVIVIGNLGLSGAATDAAVQDLPGGITLSFSPYSHKLEQYIPLARAAGHEVLLSLPMEPVSYPTNDPGPRALLTALTPSENLTRLTWLLSRFAGYVGVTNYMGSRFTTSDRDMRPILEELKKRGLLFFDSRSASDSIGVRLAHQVGLPAIGNERFIDAEASRDAIDKQLAAVEAEAKQKGHAIAMGFPYPVTIERVTAWARTLPAKGFVLAPVSAMIPERKSG